MSEPMRYLTKENVYDLLMSMDYSPEVVEKLLPVVHKAKIYRNREDTKLKVEAVIAAALPVLFNQKKVDSNV